MKLSAFQFVFQVILFCTILCEARVRIARCCSENEVIRGVKNIQGFYCVKIKRNFKTDFSQVAVYTEKLQLLNKTVMDIFDVVDASEMNINLNETEDYSHLESDKKIYLTEEANLYTDYVNRYDRFRKVGSHEFCLAYRPLKIGLAARFFKTFEVKSEKENTLYILKITGLVFSCIFLTLVLVVYGLLKELRNLRGLILMSCVGSLLAGFLVLATFQAITLTKVNDRELCLNFTLPIYFFTLASFFWMNIMSFDIWWTFRGLVRLREIHRRGDLCKYLVYCAYAWGVPLLMTVAVALIEQADLTSMPNFIKPNIGLNNCFFGDGERFLYLHVPMLILLLANTLFFVLTVLNISQVKSTRLNRSNAASQQNRFVLYLKLSAVMGINWLLEVFGSFVQQQEVMIIADMYNSLIGVIIFFIFVYRGKMMTKLQTRYSYSFKSSTWSRQRHSDASDVTTMTSTMPLARQTSQEAVPLRGMSSDPRGAKV